MKIASSSVANSPCLTLTKLTNPPAAIQEGGSVLWSRRFCQKGSVWKVTDTHLLADLGHRQSLAQVHVRLTQLGHNLLGTVSLLQKRNPFRPFARQDSLIKTGSDFREGVSPRSAPAGKMPGYQPGMLTYCEHTCRTRSGPGGAVAANRAIYATSTGCGSVSPL